MPPGLEPRVTPGSDLILDNTEHRFPLLSCRDLQEGGGGGRHHHRDPPAGGGGGCGVHRNTKGLEEFQDCFC